jgi:excisionase family DNA binding protein
MKEKTRTADEIMSYKGLAVYLKMSQNTLRHKVMQGTIPFFKIGTAVRFSKQKIDVWLNEHHREGKKKNVNGDDSLFSTDEVKHD